MLVGEIENIELPSVLPVDEIVDKTTVKLPRDILVDNVVADALCASSWLLVVESPSPLLSASSPVVKVLDMAIEEEVTLS